MRERIMRAASRPTKKAPDSNFTGTVWHEEVFAPEAPSRLRASRVSFTPGGRTNWHTHAVGQVLYVLTGVGRYQALGGPVQVILPGDTVVIPPGLKHWHGAAPDHQMAHLAMSEVEREGRGHHLARARQRRRLQQGARVGRAKKSDTVVVPCFPRSIFASPLGGEDVRP